MFVVGLTGGIASGKSTVSGILRKLGAAIIDADLIVKELQAPHTKVWQEIVAAFGREILAPDGNLDRKALGDLIFNNSQARDLLNKIVHPRVLERSNKSIMELAADGRTKACVLDVPLLIESGMTAMVDEVWLVCVPEEIQLERLMLRNNLSQAEARARLDSQMPLRDKLPFARKVIDNSGTVEQTRCIVTQAWRELLHRVALEEKPEGSI
ncbi:MAG TPA: dephospho-CoA kinase [Verrucomicrobiae bacterium]|nr:dephospho-CoA kinase [Verrucomicrobiae bacterium]